MVRKKTAAEILSGLSARTIEKCGVDWRTCSDEALIALRSKRSQKWLSALTGFTHEWALVLLRRAGLNWKTASVEDIKSATTGAMKIECDRFKIISVGPNKYTVDEYAALVDLSRSTLLRRRVQFGSWARVVEETAKRPGRWRAKRSGNVGGRPPRRVEIDGETRLYSEWLSIVDLTKQGIWKAAKRSGRTTTEELTERVRARRSDAARLGGDRAGRGQGVDDPQRGARRGRRARGRDHRGQATQGAEGTGEGAFRAVVDRVS
jgi:hypothetical protein